MGQTTETGEAGPDGSRRRVGDWTVEELLATAEEQGMRASELLAHMSLSLVEELSERHPQHIANRD